MKKKAIAELEIKEWLEEKLKEKHQTDNVKVTKSGGDSHLWFLRQGGAISGVPDYKALIDGSEYYIEFQYADRDDLDFYDFKVSKVGVKKGGKRIPHDDRLFLYIIKPSGSFAFFNPDWIMKNGEEKGVPAWGNRTAFRIKNTLFKSIFVTDDDLSPVIESINKKNRLLEIQSHFIDRERENFSGELQAVVDEERFFKIVPKTLAGFYKSCFILDNIDRHPKNFPLWLVYGTSFYSDNLNSYEFTQLIYSIDYLYGRAVDLSENEINALIRTVQNFSRYIERIQEKKFRTSVDLSPREEIVNFLFAVNLYEDLVQELRYVEGIRNIGPIGKIFQSIHNIDSVLAALSV